MIDKLKPFYSPEGSGAGSPEDTNLENDADGINTNVEDKGNEGLVAKNKELLSELKKVKLIMKKTADEAEKARLLQLAEEGKFKELYETEQQTVQNLRMGLKDKELKMLAKELNDPEDILVFKDRFEFDDNMNVTNSEEVIRDLMEKKPYLFKNLEEADKIQTYTKQPKLYNSSKNLTWAQIDEMTPAEYKKNKPEIDRQMQLGVIN